MKIFGLNFFENKQNNLIIHHSYYRNDGYEDIFRRKNISIEKFLKKAREYNKDYTYGSVSTKFNGKQYPVYDLDSQSHYERFINLHRKKNYVIFQSSKSDTDEIKHYWAIIDENVKSIKNYENVNWYVINDTNYVKFSKKHNTFDLRFTYNNLSKKPFKIISCDNLSDNFKLFIKTFEKLIDNEGLEISTLIEKNKELITYYNRKKVLEKLTK